MNSKDDESMTYRLTVDMNPDELLLKIEDLMTSYWIRIKTIIHSMCYWSHPSLGRSGK